MLAHSEPPFEGDDGVMGNGTEDSNFSSQIIIISQYLYRSTPRDIHAVLKKSCFV